ncbi:MAG: Rrf2 family transcriptional regulator [Pyramidobacter sp.]|nr:Rrf2 family transcriptional regulator [Pyramidobacter sp.]
MNPIVDLPEPLLLGLHALVELGRDPGCCLSAKHIADTLKASEGHLSKVLQRLARSGYVEAVRGPGGGYKLAMPPQDINTLVVVELLGGPLVPTGCGFEGCRGKHCLIGALVDELTIAIRDYLASKTLAHLLRYYDLEPAIRIGVSMNAPSDKKSAIKQDHNKGAEESTEDGN